MPGPASNGIPDSPLARMHPMAKIAGVCSLGLATLVWPDFTMGLGIVVMLFVAAALARVPRSFAGVMFGFGIPITLMLLFIQGCYSPKNTKVILDLGFAELGLEGSLYAAKIVVTLLVS